MKNIKILVADDDITTLYGLSNFLQLFSPNIYQASDGIDALNIYKKYKPDIILTDINMPRLNGLELSRKIRQISKESKIIILTAHTDTKYLLDAVKLHLVSYLVKPINLSELESIILKIILELENQDYINLGNEYFWRDLNKSLFYKNHQIELSSYESLFISHLIKYKNQTVSYESLHYAINELDHFSKNSITSIAKRIRYKTYKNFISNVYRKGYKISL